MINIGVIGYGYWGPNLVRNFAETEGSRVGMVCDLRPERLALVQKRHPGVKISQDYLEMLTTPEITAVAVATPVSAHFEAALKALQAGKHVLVEKPLTETSDQALRLIEEARRRNLVLLVDHTFAYTPAVRKIKELIAGGVLGEVYYYDSVRINLGLFQHDVNVFWDLAVHDLSIMDFILPLRPNAVSATGIGHVAGKPENTGYMTLFFPGSLVAHIHVSWLAPVKIRRMLIGGSQKMVVYDDLEPDEKIKIYDKGITISSNEESKYKLLVGYRTGDMLAPQLDMAEALRVEARHFIRCVEGKEKPLTDGEAGLRVVRILEAATRSMKNRGQPEELSIGE
jgi:predicted dehydrogenase